MCLLAFRLKWINKIFPIFLELNLFTLIQIIYKQPTLKVILEVVAMASPMPPLLELV